MAVAQWQCSLAPRVAIGLSSHWPSVTDSAIYPPIGSMALDREMSSPALVHYVPGHNKQSDRHLFNGLFLGQPP